MVNKRFVDPVIGPFLEDLFVFRTMILGLDTEQMLFQYAVTDKLAGLETFSAKRQSLTNKFISMITEDRNNKLHDLLPETNTFHYNLRKKRKFNANFKTNRLKNSFFLSNALKL